MPTTLSLRGLYKFDPHLFDDIELPGDLDLDTLINEILLSTVDMEVVYPDAAFMKSAIRHWSKKNQTVWTRLYNTTVLEYNPIYNKDGTFTETETRDLKGTSKQSGSTTGTRKVAGFNSNSLQNESQETTVPDLTGTATDTGTVKRERREFGNIGVTTTQQMIREEREIATYEIYHQIADMFKSEFCLMIY